MAAILALGIDGVALGLGWVENHQGKVQFAGLRALKWLKNRVGNT